MTEGITALVPMRHASERVPGKNYRLLAGKPLYHHIIRTLLACPAISAIVVDTDSSVIQDDIVRHFPQINVVERPAHLRADTTSMNEVLLNLVRQLGTEYYLQTHSTNPLLRAATVSRAIEEFRVQQPAHDSLFSVTRLQTRLWDGDMRPVNHDLHTLVRTQDLPPIYEENSCLYIFSRTSLEARGNRLGARPLMFEVDRLEAWDIDDEVDFQVAEFLYMKNVKESRLG